MVRERRNGHRAILRRSVVIDRELRGMDGLEIACRLRADARAAAVPIGSRVGRGARPVDEARAMAVRCDALMTRPVNTEQLRAVILRSVNGRFVGCLGERDDADGPMPRDGKARCCA